MLTAPVGRGPAGRARLGSGVLWLLAMIAGQVLAPGPTASAAAPTATPKPAPTTSVTPAPTKTHTPVPTAASGTPAPVTATPTTTPTVRPATARPTTVATATVAPPRVSYLIYATAHGLWRARVGGGSPRLIAHGMSRPVARLSTDGRYLLYGFPSSLTVAGRPAGQGWRQLFVCSADGTGCRVVVTVPATSFGTRFAWSADDDHFLYVRVRVTGAPPRSGKAPPWPWELRAVELTRDVATTVWSGRLSSFTPVPLAWRLDLERAYVVNTVRGGWSTQYVAIDTASHQTEQTPLHSTVTNQIAASPHQHYTALAQFVDQGRGVSVGMYAIGALTSAVTGVTLAHQMLAAPVHWSLERGDLAYTTRPLRAAEKVSFHVLSLTLGRDHVAGTDALGSEVLDWSSDGRWLLVRRATSHGRTLSLLAADGSGARHPLVLGVAFSTVAEGYLGWGVGRS